jgi:hypothetical protein
VPANRLTPAERRLAGQSGAYESWSRTPDFAARTAPARRAMDKRFEREVDPDGKLSPAERAKRAECARRAYYTRLALKSAQKRRARAEPKPPPRDPQARIAELEALAAGHGGGAA